MRGLDSARRRKGGKPGSSLAPRRVNAHTRSAARHVGRSQVQGLSADHRAADVGSGGSSLALPNLDAPVTL